MKTKSVLTSLDLLRSDSKNAQINSGIDILNHVLIKQKECGWEAPCTELQLFIRRIIRGLGSPRSNSRRGFFLTFIGLCELPNSVFTVQMCFDAIEKEYKEFCKTEENDLLKGQLLVYGGLIYSGKILQASHEEIQFILNELIIISSKKSYLMLAVHIYFIDWLEKMNIKVFKKSVWNVMLNKIILKENQKQKDKNEKSLLLFNLLFIVNNRFPRFIKKELLIDLTGFPTIFHKENLECIVKLLITSDTDLSIYQKMLTELVNSSDKLLEEVWLMIDAYLTSVTLTVAERIFRLFSCCVQALNDKNFIGKMLPYNFVALLVSESDIRPLESIRLETITSFSEVISKENSINHETQITILKNLFNPGSLEFWTDRGNKLINTLLKNVDETIIKIIVKWFVDVINNEHDTDMNNVCGKTDKEIGKKVWSVKQKQKKIACNKIIELLNHSAVIGCVDWKVEQMKIIIDLAFFSKTALDEVAKRCFYHALNFRFVRLTDLCSFLNGLVMHLNNKLITNNYIVVGFGKDSTKAWKKMIKTVNKIANDNRNTDNEKLTDTVFHVIFLLLGLTIFADSNTAVQNLEELCAIYKRMQSDSEDTKENVRKEQGVHWTDVIIDLILSLLSYNNHFHRNVICKFFVFLCPHLSSENIHQILSVLNPNTDNVLSAGSNKREADSEENVVNIEQGQDTHETDIDDDNSSNSSKESDLEEDVDESTDYDKLRTTLRVALGNAAALTDTESVDLDDLDEEEGKRLDISLSQAFKQMKQKSNAQAELKQLSDFRIRVIDLLEIWAKTRPELNLIFDVMVTVLMLLENTVQNKADLQLQNKLRSFILQLTSVKEFSTNEKLNTKQIGQLLKRIMVQDDTTSSVYKNMSQQIVLCCQFILKISLKDLKGIKKTRPLVIEAYKNALYIFLNKNSIIPIRLITSGLIIPWDGAFDLIEDILLYIFKSDVRPFCFTQCVSWLQIFLKNRRFLDTEMSSRYTTCIRQIGQKIAESLDMLLQKPANVRNKFIEIYKSIKKLNVASDIIDKIEINSLKTVNLSGKRKLDESSIKSNRKKVKCLTGIKDAEECTTATEDAEECATATEDAEECATATEDAEECATATEDAEECATVTKPNSSAELKKRKRKIAERNKALQTKKKIKFSRSEKHSQGLEEKVFGNHLFNNSDFMSGDVQDNDSDGT